METKCKGPSKSTPPKKIINKSFTMGLERRMMRTLFEEHILIPPLSLSNWLFNIQI